MGLNRKEKRDLRVDWMGFIKIGKSNEKKQTSCLLHILSSTPKQVCQAILFLMQQKIFCKVIIIIKLVIIVAKCTIAIQKLNNIIINYHQNSYINIINDKQQNNINQDWKILGQNFKTFISNLILDKIFQLFAFIFPLWAT